MKSKYYSAEQAVKMLPLVKGYCRDLRDSFAEADGLVKQARKLANMTALSDEAKDAILKQREEVREKIDSVKARFKRWREELDEMHLSSCCAELGRVDIPIFCDTLKSVILLCVGPATDEDNLEWHEVGEDVENARPYMIGVL